MNLTLFSHGPDRLSAYRAIFVAVCVMLVFAMVTWRATAVAVKSGQPRQSMTNTLQLASQRADIVDRNGDLLATSITIDSLAINPQIVWDVDEAVAQLKTVFPDLDAKRLAERMKTPGRKYEWVKRKISPRQRQAVYELGLEGLIFEKEVQRVYPGLSLAGHLIGYTDVDSNGLSGMELAHQERLSKGGEPLRLTIDTGVQAALEAELQFAADAYKVIGATGIVLEAKTGAVRGIASWPQVHPGRPGDADSNARLNRATNAVFELGSVFKPLTIAAALDAGVLRPTETFNVSKPLQIGAVTVKDRHPINAVANVTEILAHSSNVGTVKIQQTLDMRQFREFLSGLGLLSRPPIVFPGAAAPLLPPEWDELAGATVSYGHGLAVSPLALATAYTAFANNGEIVRPRFVEPTQDDQVDYTRVMSGPTAKAITQMMRVTVAEGTGRRADVFGYEVAGKTGTAEKPGPNGYDYDKNICSFIALFPASRPEYVVLIVLDEPQALPNEGKTAALNAAPITGRLIGRIAPVLDVDPVFERDAGQIIGSSGERIVSDKRAL